MTAAAAPGAPAGPAAWTLVWIDARVARIARWRDGGGLLETVESEVPGRRSGSGHVRHDPRIRHGGGGDQTAGEPHRLEHVARFVDAVAARLPIDDALEILGPGQVRYRLARRIRDADERRGARRHVLCQAAPRLTDTQLIERARTLAGSAAPRGFA